MISPRRRLFLVFAGLACGFALSGAARAENPAFSDYPSRPIVMVVPFAAGGPTDIVAQLVARGLSRALDQQVNIENIVGAGGTIAANCVRRADPDGYMIMMGHLGTHAAVTGYLPGVYDPGTDFTAIGLAVYSPVVVVERADLPPKTLSEFGIYAKGLPVVMGHAGVGSVSFAFCAKLN